jgi:6-phosphogluconolactonase
MMDLAHAAAPLQAGPQRLFIGTSNPTAHGGTGAGIYTATFHDGKLSAPELAVAAPSPSFLAVVPGTHTPIFAVLGGDAAGASAAASYATSTSALRPISNASANGDGGCHISVSADGHTVLVANYSGGSVASFRADAAGNLAQASFVQFPPNQHGPVTDRQEKAHAHSALVSPDGNFVFVNDLGLDRIHVFQLDRATSKLLPHKPDHWASAPGAGPRHLVVHPNGKWVYCINELNSTIDQLEWNATHGVLTTKSTVHTLPPGVKADETRACEMVFSHDLRFLYASNRVHESFAVFAVDSATGALSVIQELPNPGKEARHIAIDPGGKWFLSANQFSGDVSVFPLDTATGKLGPRSSKIDLAGPSCLIFA